MPVPRFAARFSLRRLAPDGQRALLERVAWVGVGLSAAGLALVAYQFLLATALASAPSLRPLAATWPTYSPSPPTAQAAWPSATARCVFPVPLFPTQQRLDFSCPFDQPHLTGGRLTRHDAAHGSEVESDGGALA